MILFYTFLLLVLGVAAFLTKRRSSSLEKKYYRVATEADRLAHNQPPRPGAAVSRSDPYQVARRQYELGRLVQKRDRLEARYDYWQRLSKRFGNVMDAVRAWKGRKLPYAFGVIDVSLALYLMEELSVGQYAGVKQLIQAVLALVK